MPLTIKLISLFTFLYKNKFNYFKRPLFPDICLLNVSGFPNTTHAQINNLHKEIDKISQMTVE